MVKYKICPSCNTKNEPTLLECFNCEADLTRVKITDEETERMLQASVDNPAPSGEANLVRICECGEKNPANSRKCSACGDDISDITPTADEPAENPTQQASSTHVLSSLDGKYAFEVVADVTIVGRETEMAEYLAEKCYVSRSHAKIILKDNDMFVENLSKTNYTYVNNKRITGTVKLEDGDVLGLGGVSINGKRQSEAAYFLVRIGQCT